MLKTGLHLRLGQNLTMTPQLQQAIKLLQLSTLELTTQIQEALEQNPMLEVEEEAETTASASENGNGQSLSEESENLGTTAEDTIPEDLPVDSQWEDIYDLPTPLVGTPDYDARDPIDYQSGDEETLQDHLQWQLDMTSLSEQDRAIASTLIDSIDENGYLQDSIERIHAALAHDLDVDLDEVLAMQHLIQHFDPIGCGAHDLREALLIQLGQFPTDTPWLAQAKTLVDAHLDLLAARDTRKLSRLLKVNEDDLQPIIELIQGLNPRPGSLVGSSRTEYIVPDVYVRKLSGHWQVELNPEISPRLRVNPLYASFVKRADTSTDNQYLRNHLQEARWFIKSLQSRNETLLRVASAIVQHQQAFLEYGEEAMKPLVLRDIAEELEMHESTISRVTTQKYMHTPRGVFEFKYFFSSHVGTADGGECSATAIRAMIRKLVAEEDSGKPLSDSRIATILKERGIQVARRTVAKYREGMNIAPSNERRRLV
ncbi:MAG: RNA polymerase factor sigma-54 [Gammaproteobacteria bacterium]|jgi:RNA polymerase sigma-54 factor